MGCNCKMTEVIIAIVILVFTFWQVSASKWIVVIAAIVLLIHALKCKNCGVGVASAPAVRKKAKGRK